MVSFCKLKKAQRHEIYLKHGVIINPLQHICSESVAELRFNYNNHYENVPQYIDEIFQRSNAKVIPLSSDKMGEKQFQQSCGLSKDNIAYMSVTVNNNIRPNSKIICII